MNNSPKHLKPFGLSASHLGRMLFKAELSEPEVRALPAQSLYMAVKHLGLDSATHVIEMASVEQCRLMIDLDCWHRDTFKEENFWEWLAAADQEGDLKALQKMIKSLDLKLVGLMIGRYVDVEIFEEPTDLPPGPSYYTPDSGYTWLRLRIEDQGKHILFGKLLALFFETSAEIFYQLISIPTVAPSAVLEEEAYQDRVRRVASEGIPEWDLALEMNAPKDPAQVIAELKSSQSVRFTVDLQPVHTLLYENKAVGPLEKLLEEIKDYDNFASEFAYITNSALVRFNKDFGDQKELIELLSQIQGTINLALEYLNSETSMSFMEIYEKLGLQKIYRCGVGLLHKLTLKGKRLQSKLGDIQAQEAELLEAVLNEICAPYPKFSVALAARIGDSSIETRSRVFETLEQFNTAEQFLDKFASHVGQLG